MLKRQRKRHRSTLGSTQKLDPNGQYCTCPIIPTLTGHDHDCSIPKGLGGVHQFHQFHQFHHVHQDQAQGLRSIPGCSDREEGEHPSCRDRQHSAQRIHLEQA
jgi:hypothetical protein